MSTYHASAIRKASAAFACADCASAVRAGDEYLDYRPGQRTHWRVCLACGLVPGENGPRYWCRAVLDRLERKA